MIFKNVATRARAKKTNEPLILVGNDAYHNQSTKSTIRSMFDAGFVNNSELAVREIYFHFPLITISFRFFFRPVLFIVHLIFKSLGMDVRLCISKSSWFGNIIEKEIRHHDRTFM